MTRSISRRLVWQVVLISVVVACLAAAYQLHAAYRSGRQDLHAYLERISATHVPALSASVWQLDEGQIRHLLAEVRGNGDLIGLVIVSGKKDSFIAGADIAMLAACTSAQDAEALSRAGQDVFAEIEALGIPVIAASSSTGADPDRSTRSSRIDDTMECSNSDSCSLQRADSVTCDPDPRRFQPVRWRRVMNPPPS